MNTAEKTTINDMAPEELYRNIINRLYACWKSLEDPDNSDDREDPMAIMKEFHRCSMIRAANAAVDHLSSCNDKDYVMYQETVDKRKSDLEAKSRTDIEGDLYLQYYTGKLCQCIEMRGHIQTLKDVINSGGFMT